MIGAVIRQFVIAVGVSFMAASVIGLIAILAGPFTVGYWVVLIVGNVTQGFVIFPRVLAAMAPRMEDR